MRSRIKALRKEKNSANVRREIKSLYAKIDSTLFQPDYMCLIIDKPKDYYRAARGYSINGVKYQRLLGTNGGIKNSTIVFVSERVLPELRRRIENGRDMEKPIVPAKLEAYKALTCSASIPVSAPNGILIVPDAETHFTSDIISLTDEARYEPLMEKLSAQDITMDATDGFGIMLPSLAKRWSEDLNLGYVSSGMNTRFSFEKGMVFTFDFIDFAEKVAGHYIVKDAWGKSVDIRDVELILTTSMVKLWDSYTSCDDYIMTSYGNGYTFGVSKTCPEELENERSLNYQFIQSYDLDGDDIDELIAPTMNDIRDVICGDWRKTVLFLKGIGLTSKNVDRLDNDFVKGIMIDNRLCDDPYVQNCIYQLIKNRINEAKVGVLKVHGNYSIVSGDPYLLCQSIFGLQLTGLLKAGEIYNQYWVDSGAKDLACFRAPMTCHNNIRMVHPVDSEETRYWYQYLKTSTVFNSWDTATAALNGCDFDGDLVMLTDNSVLVRKLEQLPALMCIQRKANKIVPTEEDLIRSNIESFGNEIGQTTNWITSMFEVRSAFPKDSEEYKTLSYRIQCGQLFQQNAIDKAKGIIAKPMPREWHDRHSANRIDDEEQREFYRSIVADKKPYFMRYIYPALMKQYNTYIKNTDRNALREFQMTVSDLLAIPEDERTDRQNEFLRYYYVRMPVGLNDCVMNKICRKFEAEFDGFVPRHNAGKKFDYSIIRCDAEYTTKQYNSIKRLYEDYNRRLKSYAIFSDYERIDEIDSFTEMSIMNDDFRKECASVCPDPYAMCNIVLDLCYNKNATKKFAWSMCCNEIISNMLAKHGNMISYPTQCETGDLKYSGYLFTVETKEMIAEDVDSIE